MVLAFLFMSVVVATPKSALAEAATPLEVTLTADRGEYHEGDKVLITVTVKNTGSDVASASAYHVTLPDSLKEMDGQVLADELGDIAPGETKTVTVEAVALAPAGGEAANTVTPVSYDTDSKTVVPETGDPAQGTAFVAMASGVLAISGVLVVVLAKKRKIGQLFSVMLVLGLSFGISCFVITPAMAKVAEPASASFELTVNGKTEYVSVSVTCSLPENPGDSDGVVYRNDVIVIKGYEEDEGTYSFTDAQNASGREVQIGDKIVLEIADDEIEGLMGTVTSVAKDGDVTVVQISQANDLAFAVEDIDIDETVSDIPMDQIKLAEGVEFDNEGVSPASELKRAPVGGSFTGNDDEKDGKYDVGKLNLKISEQAIGKYGKGTVKLTFKPYARFKLDWNWRAGVRSFNVGLGGEASLDGNLKIENKVDIPVGSFPIPVKPAGNIKVALFITPSISGGVTFSLKSDSYAGLAYDGKKILDDCKIASASSDVKLEGKVRLDIKEGLSYSVFKVVLVDASASIGKQFSPGKVVVRDNGMICTPVNEAVVLDMAVGKDTPWLKKLGITWTKKIFDEKNSPLRNELHFEDGKLVDKCTYVEPAENPDPEKPDPIKPEAEYDASWESDGLDWGTTPKFSEQGLGDDETAYGLLEEPFEIESGHSVMLHANADMRLFIDNGGSVTNDVFTITDGDGKPFTGYTPNEDGYSHGYGEIGVSAGQDVKMNVLGGQLRVTTIYSDLIPVITFGTCETLEKYPLRIPVRELSLHVGDEYVLANEEIQRDCDELSKLGVVLRTGYEAGYIRYYVLDSDGIFYPGGDYETEKRPAYWEELRDSQGDANGVKIKAQKPGTCYLAVFDNAICIVRHCKITIKP